MTGDIEMVLSEAASRYLAKTPPEERSARQQEVNRFVRWFGSGRVFAALLPAEVANYAERLSTSDTDYIKKLELVRGFLTYVKKEGWSKDNLATHLKARKEKPKIRTPLKQSVKGTISLSPQGYADLEAELVILKERRIKAIEEVQRAAADKDFRENVPLEAAREERGYLEGRIKELEETLKMAVLINDKPKSAMVGIGDNVVLCNLNSGEEVCYMLVSPREVNAAKGKISLVSPIGQAVMGREQGEIVVVIVPAGKMRYQIKKVGH